MFESFRGTEYGWETGASFRDGITTSNVFFLIEGLTRADIDERWKISTRKVLREVFPGFRLGTPMDHAAQSLLEWRKLVALSRTTMRETLVLGSHSRATLLDHKPPKFLINLLWHQKFNYNTPILSVIEQRVTAKKMDELFQLLRDKTGGEGKFDAASDKVKLEIVKALEHSALAQGFYLVNQFAWLPKSQEPEQLEASTYSDACNKYQASIAGKRAKRLLLENLTKDQERDYWRHGYFFVMPHGQDSPLHERRLYVIERSFPNGNVLRVKQKKARGGRWHWYPEHVYCFHTEEPHAVDDILLSQKLTLENEEPEFLKSAHVTKPMYNGLAPLEMAKRSV